MTNLTTSNAGAVGAASSASVLNAAGANTTNTSAFGGGVAGGNTNILGNPSSLIASGGGDPSLVSSSSNNLNYPTLLVNNQAAPGLSGAGGGINMSAQSSAKDFNMVPKLSGLSGVMSDSMLPGGADPIVEELEKMTSAGKVFENSQKRILEELQSMRLETERSRQKNNDISTSTSTSIFRI